MSVADLINRLKKDQIHIQLLENQLKINAPKHRLTPGLVEELKERKEEIIRFLVNFSEGEEYVSIEAAEKKEYYVLSSPQKRLYLLWQMSPESAAYNMCISLTLEKNIDTRRLKKTLKRLISRHESLRTSFIIVNEEPVQQVHDEVEFEIELYSATEEKAGTNLSSEFIRPFDLSHAPLLRVGLIETGESNHILILDMHHIITDGTSQHILTKEFMELYAGKEQKPLRLQYKDFPEWQNSNQQQQLIKKQEQYWLNIFSGQLPVLGLPIDHKRPEVQSFAGTSVKFFMDEKETRYIKNIVNENDATLFMFLLAAFNILLSKLSGQEDIIVGIPIAARRHKELENIIGMFVNTLAPRNYPGGDKTFIDFLGEIKKRTLEAFENQEYPFEDLVDKVSIGRDVSRNPLFDVMFILQNMEIVGLDIPGLKVMSDKHEINISKFDLSLTVREAQDGLFFSFEYSTKLFKKKTIERFITYFKKILSYVLKEKDTKISEIEIIDEKEKNQLLFEFNKTGCSYPADKRIHQIFAEQVLKTTDSIAVIGRGQMTDDRRQRTDNILITYKELNKGANQLARLLKEKGVGTDTIVAIMVERSIEMIIGIFGILKAGGAYLPIDPEYPEDRINYMMADSGAKVLVPTSSLANLPSSHLHLSPAPVTSLAYIIYTSGTTGKPKGVMISHRNLVRLFVNSKNPFDFRTGDVWTMFHSHCFDFSVWEIYGALLNGGRLILIPAMVAKDTPHYLQILKKQHVTVLNQTPSAFYNLINHEFMNSGKNLKLRYVILGGEALTPARLEQWRDRYPETRLINMFGITETTVHVTFKEITNKEIEQNISNIGRPIPTVTTYVMDKNKRLLPSGVAGELCIGGDGVARGYLNRPQLTFEKFVENPIKPGELLYRSGDLVRFINDGDMQYLGRMDHQVQLRGYRIELGEIENRLLSRQGVKGAVVIDREDESGDKYLCAYIVPHKGRKLAGNEAMAKKLRKHLSKTLPDYMIPLYFVLLDEIPLTPNGKIDRDALPAPGANASQSGYTPPRDQVEIELAALWSEVLNIEQVGINDNFFELGGHSLKATVLASKIHKAFNIKIPLAELFKTPFIRGISSYIKKAAKIKFSLFTPIKPTEKKAYHLVSSAQKRLYFLQQMEEDGIGYNIPQMVILEGNIEIHKLENMFKELIKRHESLRTSFEIVENQAVQRIHDNVEFEIECYNNIHSFIRPFDLSQAPLLRVGLAKYPHTPPLPGHPSQEGREQKHILMVDMHHIITDGMSWQVLVTEFMDLYAGRELPPLRIYYKDYACWQNSEKEKERIKKQELYWTNEFKEEILILNLPSDYSRPALQGFEGSAVGFALDKEETGHLKKIAANLDSTLYMVLLGIFNILLSKLGGQEDIIVGTPTAGRRYAGIEHTIGMFVNTLAARNYPCGEKTLKDFLEEVKIRTLEAFENQEYPFEDLVEKVSTRRDVSRNPLFDVMFTLQNLEMAELVIPGLKLIPYNSEINVSKFDLSLTGTESQDRLFFSFEFSTKLFKKETIERFTLYFKKIVSYILKDRDTKISEIEIIDEEEKNQLLFEFNKTGCSYPADKRIHQIFTEQVKRTPDYIALHGCMNAWMHGKGHITYGELNKKSDQLAHLLKEKGVMADTIMAIMVERSVVMVIGLLGILKAGGAYLPLDPDSPEERIKYMLGDSGAGIILTSASNRFLNFSEGQHFNYQLSMSSQPATRNPQLVKSLAYILYTSGSTGKPKGVMVEHRNAVNLVKWFAKTFDVKIGTHILQLTDFTFDPSVEDIFSSLLHGAVLYMIDKDLLANPGQLRQYIETYQVHLIDFIPSFLKELLLDRPKLESLRTVISGGERLEESLKNRLLDIGYTLYNNYGPTEITVDALFDKCSEEKVSLGKPLSNVTCYILDKDNNPAPIGVIGELCIAGAGVTRGYLNNPELTFEKFINYKLQITKKKVPGKRIYMSHMSYIYRTGDMARWRPDGKVEYIGRQDYQIKLRGYRIELAEIETLLKEHPGIENAVVTPPGEKENLLIAYYVMKKSGSISISSDTLQDYLKGKLPDYMIPAYFIRMENIPLTSTGKIDRNALPEPEVTTEDQNYIPPGNEMEEKLMEIWQEVLGVEKIGTTDNFFQIGGDSIKAIQLSARLRKYRLDLKINDLFLHPTIKESAKYVKPSHQIIGHEYQQGAIAGEVPLTPIQQWSFENHFPHHHHYNHAVMLYNKEGFDETIIRKLFTKIALHHDALRMVYKVEGDKIVQWNRGTDIEKEGKLFDLEVFQLTNPGRSAIEREANRIQAGIDLARGPLMKLGLFKTTAGDHLLIVIHHLVVDGISWRILFEDFRIGCQQLQQGEEIKFQEKTVSFQYWAQQLKKYSQSKEILRELEYWERIEKAKSPPLPVDYKPGEKKKKYRDMESLRIDFNEEETGKLLKDVHRPYNTNINDILLTALGMATREWSGNETIVINLEGHGREPTNDDRYLDTSRTIGWFTCQFPVLLDMSNASDLSTGIKVIKETLRRIPNKGIGCGLLRYLTPGDKKKGVRLSVIPEISFNYLGQFHETNDSSFFTFSQMHTGEPISPELESIHKIDINGLVKGETLTFSFTYNTCEYRKETIQQLAHGFKTNLIKIIEHCTEKEKKELTPSDLGDEELSLEELEDIKDMISL